MNKKRQMFTTLAAIVLPLLSASSPALGQAPDEFTLKAALNYNFAKYTEWPILPGGEIEFCFFNDDYRGSFEPLRGRTIDGRRVSIRQLADVSEIDACQLLFLDAGNDHLLNSLLAHLENKAVLTVSDASGFAERGGMIEILTVDNKLRFRINLAELQEQGINMGSQVLNLAMEILR